MYHMPICITNRGRTETRWFYSYSRLLRVVVFVEEEVNLDVDRSGGRGGLLRVDGLIRRSHGQRMTAEIVEEPFEGEFVEEVIVRLLLRRVGRSSVHIVAVDVVGFEVFKVGSIERVLDFGRVRGFQESQILTEVDT